MMEKPFLVLTFMWALVIMLSTARCSQEQVSATVNLNPEATYQTITGWSATTAPWHVECQDVASYEEAVYDKVVYELGLNRARLEIRAGTENSQDNFTAWQDGTIEYSTWRSVRYTTVNDNDDPFSLDLDGFQFSEFDFTIEHIILPLKERVESQGEELYINVTYVAFTGQNASGLQYLHDDPEEYAEFVLATYVHMQDKYGLAPDSWEIILEPDNVSQWDGRLIGEAVVAAAQRLEAAGFTPSFVVPSNTHMGRAIDYFDAMMRVEGVAPYLREFSYHRYKGVSQANLEAIVDRAQQYGISTAMLEHLKSGHEDLHEDLKVGQNTAWQQYSIANCPNRDKGHSYYWIDERGAGGPVINVGDRTRYLRQYFRYIRRGALRIEATSTDQAVDPLAFINADSGYVVVVNADAPATIDVAGLPSGIYGVRYTTEHETHTDGGDVVVEPGASLQTSIPSEGALTIFFRRPVAHLSASPTVLDFGEVPVGMADTLSFAIENTGGGAATITGVEHTTSAFMPLQTAGEIPANGTLDLSVAFAPTTTGAFTDTLKVHSSASSNPLTIALQGEATTNVHIDEDAGVPVDFQLRQNYPNPFRSSTQITYALPQGGHVTLQLFNVSGQLHTTLVDQKQRPGIHTIDVDASGWPSGTYLYRIVAGRYRATGAMALVR